MNTSEHVDEVNSESSACDLLWGVVEIARSIGRTHRQTSHLITSGHLKSPKKVGGHWVVSRSALMAELGAPQ
jgi:hypothetical protein